MLNNEFPPLGGGTGVVNYHLLREMSSYDDLYVDLVASSRTRSTYETTQFAPRITIYKVPVNNKNIHHASARELLTYALRGLLTCRRLLKQHRYDLSFAFAGVPAGAISYALKLSNGLPYLVSLQGPDVPGFEARYNYLYPFLRPVIRTIWKNAGIVTAISKEHRRLARETLPNLQIVVVHNGVDGEVFRPPDARQDGKELVRILCVGRLIERKGQQHLLRAFSNLHRRHNKAIKLILIGTGDAEGALRSLAQELQIDNAVTFAGFVPQEEMPDVYRQAEIFVLPSQSEGMSIALLEAMATGLPVIVTNTGGVEELVRGGWNGRIVRWSDVDELEDALTSLVQSEPLRTEMGKASRTIAMSFHWSTIAQEYLGLCAQIAGTSDELLNKKATINNLASSG